MMDKEEKGLFIFTDHYHLNLLTVSTNYFYNNGNFNSKDIDNKLICKYR